MAEMITVLVKRAAPFWLPGKRGPADKKTGRRPSICGKLMLRPGTNEIPRSRWDATKDHPAVVVYLETGGGKKGAEPLLVVNPGAREKTAHTNTPDRMTGLKSLTIDKATVWIEGSTDAATLESWRTKDDRKGIHALIDARLDALSKGGDDDDDAGSDDDDEDPLEDEHF